MDKNNFEENDDYEEKKENKNEKEKKNNDNINNKNDSVSKNKNNNHEKDIFEEIHKLIAERKESNMMQDIWEQEEYTYEAYGNNPKERGSSNNGANNSDSQQETPKALEYKSKILEQQSAKATGIDINDDTKIPIETELSDQKGDFEKQIKDNDKGEKNKEPQIKQLLQNENKNILKKKEREKMIEGNNKIPFSKDKGNISKYDEQLIKTIITKIEENEKNEKNGKEICIKIEKTTFITFSKYCGGNENKNYVIKNLLNSMKYYMEKNLEFITNSKINFHDISLCFIIDCSQYFSFENKLFNLLVALSIIKILYIIDIEFSIFLSADDKFKVVIKNYEEYINYEDLIEFLYETIFIERFRNNTLKTVQTAIENLKNKKRKTIYFGFFDKMDESFACSNYWINNILNDKTNLFILILEKSRLYEAKNSKNSELIDKMIKSFEDKINTGSKNIKIIHIENINFDDLETYLNLFIKTIDELSTSNAQINSIVNDNENKDKDENENKNNLKDKKKKYFEEILVNNLYANKDKIFWKDNERRKLNINQLEKKEDEDKDNIIIPKINKKDNFSEDNFFKILKNSRQDKTLIETIFYPNKATQKMPSTKGTEIDIMALILYTLLPVQEPMIYLEYKGGLVRDYSISIIIDNSKSCFSEFNEAHSFLTLFNLLQIVNLMAFPSLDLILSSSNRPDILLYDKPSITIFQNYAILEEMLKLLSNPKINTDLSKAIQAVYQLKKKKRNMRDTYLFILTDGLSYNTNEKKINNYLNLCMKIGIKINIIGLGIYPSRAKYFLDSFIYSANPNNLLRALSKIFGKSINTKSVLELNLDSEKKGDLKQIQKQLNENKKLFFDTLITELNNFEIGNDVFIFGNIEKDIYEKMIFVEEGKDLEIYSPEIVETQEILMVMLWSFDLNKKNESPYVAPRYIDEPTQVNGNVSIRKAIEDIGIKNKIVVDYKSAIDKLLEKNEKNECNYYAVWIFCGPQYAILPPGIDGEANQTSPYLVEQFINVLIKFWKNGGALVFFAEGEPLNFQVNLFLEKIEFSNNEKPNFRIHGEYIGDKYLAPDKEGKLDKAGRFNKSEHRINYNGKEIKRQSLSHNIGQIYEGYTISYAVDENNKKISFNEFKKLLPFKPFSINSEGGISTLIYEADTSGCGDIIIDCGYTKCFFNMYKSGTFRFIQNIAGWTVRPEIKFLAENINPKEWRPKGLDCKVDYQAKYEGFLKLENLENDISNMRTLFCIDDSGSTEYDKFYYNEVKNIIERYYDEKRGDILYFWNDGKTKVSYEQLQLKIEKTNGTGGTEPYLIAQIIDEEKQNECKHLIIITDGNVNQNDILFADEKMKKINYKFDFVSVYILGNQEDLSVGAPFCRNTPNKTMAKKSGDEKYKELLTLSKIDIETLENIKNYYNYNEFKNNYEKIFNAVQAKCIGTCDGDLKKKLEIMFDNIIKNNNNIDKEFIENSKKALIGMTEGSIKNSFTLDKIKAATYNLKK